MKNLSVEKAIGIFFIFLIVFGLIFTKFLGASYIVSGTELLEKDGFCKVSYGEDWDYEEDLNYCFKRDEQKEFTQIEFREVCPKNEFISTKFYSDCFHQGDSRSG
ncbi:hypothetical protein LCGC14_0556500 [marine sediment metagenome]|uniref:Transmembrane protein n=1 Tax=marine sediment metagenome TaxID=412755 RepID=A0A0F9S6T9_9ZZZZ